MTKDHGNANSKWFGDSSRLRISLLFILFAYCLNNKWDVTMMDFIIFHPERAHYNSQQLVQSTSNRLFEGWYYKISSKDIQLAIIPGTYHSAISNENHAFIMFITADFYYEYRYSLDQYTTSAGAVHTDQQFHLHIGPNNLSRTGLSLYLEPRYIHSIQPTDYPNTTDIIQLRLTFHDQDAGFPISLFRLGAVSYSGWFPFLECYHAILSMNFLVHGTVAIADTILYQYRANDTVHNSPIANGYLEKDWGSNFPQSWIWIQANQFTHNPNVSLIVILSDFLSTVPVLGQSVAAFIGGLYINRKLYTLSATELAKVTRLDITDDDIYRNITIEINNVWNTQRLMVVATIPNVYHLKSADAMKLYPHILSPEANGYMMPTIMEWMNATVSIHFEDTAKGLVFDGVSTPSNVECHSPDHMEWILAHFN